MNSLQEELISRYVDGDLSSAEAAHARLLIETDPGARSVFEHYQSLSESLAELPRHEIPVDMVSRLQPLLNRRMPLWREMIHFNRWLVGAAVAGISGVAGALLLWPDTSPEAAPKWHGKMLTSALNEASDPPRAMPEEAEPDAAAVAELKKSVEVAKSAVAAKAVALTPVASFVNQLARVDRRHSIRLHVESASKRVEDDVLTALARYRGTGTEIMAVDHAAEGETPSLRFIALVPTRSVQGLIGQLGRQFDKRLELDLPEDLAWLKQNAGHLRPVAVPAASGAAPNAVEAEESPTKNQKFGPDAHAVPDALAKPLENAVADGEPGTMDEVMIQIRTDLLMPDSTKASSTKPRNRPQPANRK